MKLRASHRIRVALAAVLTLGLFLMPLSNSRAQSVSFGEAETPGIVAKQKLTRVIETLQNAESELIDESTRDSLDEAQTLLNQMNSEELDQLATQVGPQIDQMVHALDRLREISEETQQPPPFTPLTTGFPNAPYPDYDASVTESATESEGVNSISCDGANSGKCVKATSTACSAGCASGDVCIGSTCHDLSGSCNSNSDCSSGFFCHEPPECDEGTQASNDSFVLALQWKCESTDGTPKDYRSTVSQAYASQIAFIAAEAVRDIASRICQQEFGILVAGGNVSVLCIPVDIIYSFAKSIYTNIAICDGFVDAAEIAGNYHRLEHVHEDIGSHMTSLTNHDTAITNAMNASKTSMLNRTALAQTNLTSSLNTHHTVMQAAVNTHDAAVKSDIMIHDVEIKAALATHDVDIKTLLAEKKAFFLRLEIEEALQRHERDAIYYLPEADGGLLGLTRAIVGETITTVATSGEPTNYASYYLYQADLNISYGNYKRAWDWMCDAYRKAVQINGERQP